LLLSKRQIVFSPKKLSFVFVKNFSKMVNDCQNSAVDFHDWASQKPLKQDKDVCSMNFTKRFVDFDVDNEAYMYDDAPSAEKPLVDIDPSEGRKMGNLLMSMLTESDEVQLPMPAFLKPPQSHSSEAAPRHRLLASAPCFVPGYATTTQHSSPYATPPPELEDPPAPQHGRFSMFGGASISAFLPIVIEAANLVFGSDLEEVDDSGDSFVIRVGGDWRRQGGGDPQTILNALSQALWPRLENVLTIENNIIPRRTWLSVACKDMSSTSKDQCWDFMTSGYCRRGGACRWAHCKAQKFDIEVMYC